MVTRPHAGLRRGAALVRAAAWLVPARLRADWRREWEGELAAWADDGRAARPLRHALGAFADAFWIRQRDVADLSLARRPAPRLAAVRQHAGFAIMAIGILGAGHGGVGDRVQRRVADPAAAAALSRSRSHRHAVGAAAGHAGPARRRARQLPRLARTRDVVHARWPAPSRTATTTPAAIGPRCGAAQRHRRVLRELRQSAAARAAPSPTRRHVKAATASSCISARLWRSRFAADPAIVGRRIPLDDEPWDVVGVMPDDFLPHFQEVRPGESRPGRRRRSRSTSRASAPAATGTSSAG